MTTSNAIATSIPTVSIVNNQAKTTSLAVAEFFGKRHADVLRAIENLDCSPEFTSTHFCVHAEIIQAGAVARESKYYEMTKNGFVFLVMGFTGKRAAQFKEAYIKRFDEMENALHNPLALTNGQHYVVAKDGVVIYHKVLSDRTAKNYLQPTLPPVDNLAALKKDLAQFCAPEDPHLQITYATAQRTLSLLSALIVHLESHGFNMALMYQKTQYVQNFLTNYYSRLEAIHYQMNSISKQMSLDAINYAADISKHPTVVSCYGAKIA